MSRIWPFGTSVMRSVVDFLNSPIHFWPNRARAACQRGNAAFDSKEYDQAIRHFTEAIRLDPKMTAAYFGRGTAHYARISAEGRRTREGKSMTRPSATTPRESITIPRTAEATVVSPGRWPPAQEKICATAKKKALELGLADKEQTAKAHARLRLYEEGKPYRESHSEAHETTLPTERM
jgi:tetratricopeptide (TPR) repeat protein